MASICQRPAKPERPWVDLSALTTALSVVLRENPRAGALLHVVRDLDDLVDVSWQWSLARACMLQNDSGCGGDGGAQRLVARIVSRRPLSTMDPFYRQAQVSVGLANAARRGNVELLCWLLERLDRRVVVDETSGVFKAVGAAAANGHIEILRLLLDHDKLHASVESAMLCAAQANEFEALCWLQEKVPPHASVSASTISSLLEAAAANGNLRMASWINKAFGEVSGPQTSSSAVERAIAGGHLDMAKWLRSGTESCLGPVCLDEAAGNGHLHILKWGNDHGGYCSQQAMDIAASNGHLDVVQWLHFHRSEGCTTRAMDGAASNGHLNVVQWLHSHRSEGCTDAAMDGAASANHLGVVAWLHANRSEGCTVRAVDEAAGCGHLVVIQWLLANRPEDGQYSLSALENAAANGHLEATTWLYERLMQSSDGGEETIQSIGRAMDMAASGGHLGVFKWLHSRRPKDGACTATAMDGAASNGHLRMVEWLHANRREGCTTRAMDGAAAGGHFEVLLFLNSHRREGCTSDAAVNAALGEHVEIVQWLLQRYPQQAYHERVRSFASRHNFSLLDWFHRSRALPMSVR